MDLNYTVPGGTCVADASWRSRPNGYRAVERTVAIGRGDEDWASLSDAVMHWELKTRTGFTVKAVRRLAGPVRIHENYTAHLHIGPLKVREPVRVVALVDEPDRRGFAYGTQGGHPLSGEGAFITHRDAEGTVWLTVRSLTRAARGPWMLAYPGARVAQGWWRRRYLRALSS